MTDFKGVIVYVGGCFATSHKNADFVNVDAVGTLHVWRGDEHVAEYLRNEWENYELRDNGSAD